MIRFGILLFLLGHLLSCNGKEGEGRKVALKDYPESISINVLPKEIRVVGTITELSPGYCGIICQGGYIKVRLEANIPNFNYRSVYLITACLGLGVKPGAKVDVVAWVHTGKETECYYESFARPKYSDKFVFYKLSERETAKVPGSMPLSIEIPPN